MKAKLFIIFFTLVMVIPASRCMIVFPDGTAPATTTTKPSSSHLEQGDSYFDQGLYDKAIEEYNHAIDIDPDTPAAYWGRGRVYHFDRGLFSRAIDDYSRAIELNQEYVEAYYYRGLAQEANGVYDRAIDDFSRAIQLDPGLSMAYNIRAWCYVRKAQWDTASQLAQYQLFENDQDLAGAYQGKGWASVKQPQWGLFAIPYLVADPGYAASEGEYDNKTEVLKPEEPDKIKGKFPARPYVKITPTSGPVGAGIYIYGWGFRTGEDGITVSWDNEILLPNIVAETDGSIIVDGSLRPDGSTRDTISVPPSARGDHVIGVYGSSFTPKGIIDDTIFEVIPEIKLALKPDVKGTKIAIHGTGFAADETIIVTLDKLETNATAITDNTGRFNTVLIAPTIKEKEYIVVSSGDKGNSAQAGFTIYLARPVPDKLEPDLAELYYNRGYAHFKKAQWALAITELDRAYEKDPALNRGAWNKDWAEPKQQQWDMVIADYDQAITVITGSFSTENKPGPGELKEELTLALADYNRAAGISGDPALEQKAKDSIKFIDEWSKNIE